MTERSLAAQDRKFTRKGHKGMQSWIYNVIKIQTNNRKGGKKGTIRKIYKNRLILQPYEKLY